MSVSLLPAEAQVGDGFRDVNFAKQLAVGRIAAHAVLVRIAPAHRTPDPSLGVTADAVGNARLRHFCEDFAVRHLPRCHIEVEYADMGWVVWSVRESGVADIELLFVG